MANEVNSVQEWLEHPRRTNEDEIYETGTSFDSVREKIGLTDPYYMASIWPDFPDGRKARLFLTDPRLTEETKDDKQLVQQVVREIIADMAEAWG